MIHGAIIQSVDITIAGVNFDFALFMVAHKPNDAADGQLVDVMCSAFRDDRVLGEGAPVQVVYNGEERDDPQHPFNKIDVPSLLQSALQDATVTLRDLVRI